MADDKNEGPFNRVEDVPAGPTEGGPTNPTLDALKEEELVSDGSRSRFPWEGDPTADVEQGSPAVAPSQKSEKRPADTQPAVTPAGSGVAADAGA